MTISIAVVIPTYGAARLPVLRRTLESLTEVNWPEGFAGIWLVENGPQVGAQAVCAEFAGRLPALHYLHEPKLGLTVARNAGAAASCGDYIVFFDNDIRVGKDALLAYERAFSQYGPQCCFGGPVFPEYEAPPPEWLCPYLPTSVVYRHLADSTGPIPTPLLIGTNHGLSRSLLQALGGYDSIGATGNRGGLGEETRLQQRIQAAGGQVIYIADAPVWHYVPASECSPGWALAREFRHGLTQGLLDPLRGRHRVAGAPIWAWQRWLRLTARVYAHRLRGESLEKRFALEYERAEWAGVIAGCRGRKKSNLSSAI